MLVSTAKQVILSFVPRWTKQDYEAFEARRLSKRPVPEQVVFNDALATDPGKKGDGPRLVVRYLSRRKRLLDPDNLFGGTKYFTDALRHCGLIPDDDEASVKIEVEQERVSTAAGECTVITIEEISPRPTVETMLPIAR